MNNLDLEVCSDENTLRVRFLKFICSSSQCSWFPWHDHPYYPHHPFPNPNQLLSYELHAYRLLIIFYVQTLSHHHHHHHHLPIHLLHFVQTVARHQVHIKFGANLQDLGNGSPAKNDWNILNALLG
jgi:hypothetical protein